MRERAAIFVGISRDIYRGNKDNTCEGCEDAEEFPDGETFDTDDGATKEGPDT